MKVRTGLGQDSHRFEASPTGKPFVLGAVTFEGVPALEGNSDADAVLHALVNALSGLHGVVVLGPVSDALCRDGVTDSRVYVREALKYLGRLNLSHVSVSIECKRPPINPKIPAMRASLAGLLGLEPADVAVTAHSGEGLSAVGRGEGVFATVLVTAVEP
ncbi:MAG TPA: 2-C-methyl-D-erythritol 2,4-cyclodiphosphate synthase [bacterium]|jgi:2-C-methyl-D-erythritol 2,4-cyclodiphosphate synthase|nr:2-C-methyl-D-erythritol 2,4-cyclodiphosphate synthase [bacterium]